MLGLDKDGKLLVDEKEEQPVTVSTEKDAEQLMDEEPDIRKFIMLGFIGLLVAYILSGYF